MTALKKLFLNRGPKDQQNRKQEHSQESKQRWQRSWDGRRHDALAELKDSWGKGMAERAGAARGLIIRRQMTDSEQAMKSFKKRELIRSVLLKDCSGPSE